MASKRKSIMLFLIRCGETVWDTETRLHGHSDLPLSAAGHAAVEEVAASVAGQHVATIYHAPDEAASETARSMARAMNGKAKSVDELTEANLGVLDGLTERAFSDRFPKRYKQWQDDPLSLSPPEGEDLVDARARIFAACSRILKRSRSDEVGIVLHPLGLGFLRCWLADRPSTDVWVMVKKRPPLERYLLSAKMIGWLEKAAKLEYSHS